MRPAVLAIALAFILAAGVAVAVARPELVPFGPASSSPPPGQPSPHHPNGTAPPEHHQNATAHHNGTAPHEACPPHHCVHHSIHFTGNATSLGQCNEIATFPVAPPPQSPVHDLLHEVQHGTTYALNMTGHAAHGVCVHWFDEHGTALHEEHVGFLPAHATKAQVVADIAANEPYVLTITWP
ncbi:MAG: hypothetical protein V4510_11535 [bacterium]